MLQTGIKLGRVGDALYTSCGTKAMRGNTTKPFNIADHVAVEDYMTGDVKEYQNLKRNHFH